MTKLGDALRHLVGALPRGERYALVGGLAVSARAEPRFTRAIDVAIAAANDAAAEAVVFGLRSHGYAVDMTVEQQRADRMSTVRLRRGPSEPIIDLLFASSGIEAEVTRAATELMVLGSPFESQPSGT